MMSETKVQICRWRSEIGAREADDAVATEDPLEIQVDLRSVSVTMRTPGHDEELAVGFLVGEGLIRDRNDLHPTEPFWRHARGNLISVLLADRTTVDLSQLTRHVFASSSCGLCGKATIESLQQKFRPIASRIRVDPEKLLALPESLKEAQQTFQQTGGLHAAGIFTTDGELVVSREDVGRHNAVDKVIGFGLLNGLLPYNDKVLMVSGRTSFEILQKALGAGVPIVAAISAPSSLAIEFAQANNQTLIGFLRAGRMNIYTHPARVCSLAEDHKVATELERASIQ